MRRVIYTGPGNPSDVVRVEAFEPARPGAGDVAVDVKACPINPGDFLWLRGQLGARTHFPALAGVEGVGVVVEVGSGVTSLHEGDVVLLPIGGTWSERLVAPAESFTALPQSIDLLQASMLSVNPMTASCLLDSYGALRPGDWVIQNVANSAVGKLVIRLARARGIRTVNVVRRAAAGEGLPSLGADVVVVDGPDLAREVASRTGGAAIGLAFDAVAGRASGRLVECLAPGGTLVVYGLLSNEPIQVPAVRVAFERISVTGFFRVGAVRDLGPERARARYLELAAMVMDGRLTTHIEATYPIDQVREALAHAERGERSGKIVLTF